MHDPSDTIVAVSSSGGGVRSIVRLTGPQTLAVCARIFEPSLGSEIKHQTSNIKHPSILSGSVRIGDRLVVDAWLYLFFAPHSYTGEDLAEIHVHAGRVLVEALVQDLLARGLRPAGPGEFTARAYLNGKLDLAQAEAVNEVISSSNRLQLEAAQKLLSGRLSQTAEEIHSALLDILSLIEASLDFSGEEIEFITPQEAAQRLREIQTRLDELLASSIRCETLLDLPAVGIAGAPNAGKSSLLNALLGWERSIVSPQAKTTRDVLSGVLTTDQFQCVLFDCAGLLPVAPPPPGVNDESTRGWLDCIDELAQQAALEALQGCAAVLFCVDSAKTDLREDPVVRSLIQAENVIHVATKSDMLCREDLSRQANVLSSAFGAQFASCSAKTGDGLPELLRSIEKLLLSNATRPNLAEGPSGIIGLTARHRQAVTEAREQIIQAIAEVVRGNEEVAVMMIRTACQALGRIEQQSLDEQVLDRIFSRFCIGK